MQSEVESWAEPIVDSSIAAHPAICASRIKREIIDMAGKLTFPILIFDKPYNLYL